MKKILSVITVILFLSLSGTALAQRPSVTVGLKTWYASWTEKVSGEAIESDYGLMYGPNLNLRYEKFFGGISYLTGGGFSFPTESIPVTGYGTVDVDSEADRTDMDISVGYYFMPNIAVFFGYKTIDSDLTYTFTDPSLGISVDVEEKWKFNGPAFGVSGYYPIGQSRWILFGSLGFVSLSGDIDGSSTDDISGPTIEVGGAYGVEDIPLSVSVGFKWQNYSSGDYEDTFSGLTLGANYTF